MMQHSCPGRQERCALKLAQQRRRRLPAAHLADLVGDLVLQPAQGNATHSTAVSGDRLSGLFTRLLGSSDHSNKLCSIRPRHAATPPHRQHGPALAALAATLPQILTRGRTTSGGSGAARRRARAGGQAQSAPPAPAGSASPARAPARSGWCRARPTGAAAPAAPAAAACPAARPRGCAAGSPHVRSLPGVEVAG